MLANRQSHYFLSVCSYLPTPIQN